MSEQILTQLISILKERQGADPETSYVASLYTKGLDEILKKVGEESVELIIAAKSSKKKDIIYEMADVWFHCLVLLSACDIQIEDVFSELSRRVGQSGLQEKRER